MTISNPPVVDIDADEGVAPAEYCPVSIGAKLIGDRWSLLIVRELMAGSSRFNDIHRGLPGLSRTLLSDRLRHLERLGLVTRIAQDEARGWNEYFLTEVGLGLRPVIEAIGAWTIDWHFPRPTDEQSDPSMLLWRLYQGLMSAALPNGRICIEFLFPETEPSRGWIRIDPRGSSVCFGSPESAPDVVVTAKPRVWNEVWYGHSSFERAIADGHMSLEANAEMARQFPKWFRRSPFAEGVSARVENLTTTGKSIGR